MARSILSKYRLGRAAVDLRTFTAEELASFTRVPVNTVYAFLHHLGSGVTKESLPSDSPGRPRTRYSLTSEGVEWLIDENLEIVGLIESLGLDTGVRVGPGPAIRARAEVAEETVAALLRPQAVDAGPVVSTRVAAAATPFGRTVPARAAAAFAAGAQEAAGVAARVAEAWVPAREWLTHLHSREVAAPPGLTVGALASLALAAEAPAPAAAAFAAGAQEAAAVAAAAPATSEAEAPKAGAYAAAAFAAGASAAAAYVTAAAPTKATGEEG
jgi:DNA-binding PadR family transcriptional regulator